MPPKSPSTSHHISHQIIPPTRSSSSSSSGSLSSSALIAAFRNAVSAAEVQIKRCAVPKEDKDEHDENEDDYGCVNRRKRLHQQGSPRGVREIGPQHLAHENNNRDDKEPTNFVTSAMGILRSSFVNGCSIIGSSEHQECTRNGEGSAIQKSLGALMNYGDGGAGHPEKAHFLHSPGRTDQARHGTFSSTPSSHSRRRSGGGRRLSRGPDETGPSAENFGQPWQDFDNNPFQPGESPDFRASPGRRRHHEDPFPPPPSHTPVRPIEDIELREDDLQYNSSISELTMRSSYGAAVLLARDNATLPIEDRRMAYYAVGKSRDSSDDGIDNGGDHEAAGDNAYDDDDVRNHRRCYFSGRPLCPPEPFYAGLVQQGSKTLVVFCLPDSIRKIPRRGDGTEDNYAATPAEDLLQPDGHILDRLKECYPDEYMALPIQVRVQSCWRIYTRFCYFSGLPIAEGELHYRVKDNNLRSNDITQEQKQENNKYGSSEEITLSHEVMVAVVGEESADILRAPSQRTLKYLKRCYPQQSSKLSDVVFHRSQWEIVLPEC